MTSLAQQLQRLALPQSNFGSITDKSRPSLLFETKQAATFDKDFFYAVGLNGFQELCGLEPTFHGRYFDTLFSEVAADTERSVKSKQFNKELDAKIQSFLLQLSPYSLLKPAQKCIEWLVYRFRIHAFNIESLMKCVLPYYGTNLFIRVVQLIDKKNRNWSWLSEAQADGNPLSMRTMITYCMKNLAFLEFLSDSLLEAIKIQPKKQGNSWQIRGILNLFTSTVLGVVHKMDSIPETFMLHLMPVVLKGIKSRSADFQASSLMIISQLSVKVNFEAGALTSIVNLTTKHCLPQLHKEAIRMIALLCQVQEKLRKFTKRAFRRLSAMENFVSQVVIMSSNQRTHNFLSMYFDALVPRAFVATDTLSTCDSDEGSNAGAEYSTIFKSLVEDTHLSDALQTHVFELLILNYKEQSASMSDATKDVAHRMQRKYPTTFDKVISDCVEKKTVSAKILKSYLTISLASAKHQLLPDTSMTLSIALLHPEPMIRVQGLETLMEELSSSKCLAETKRFACPNLLQMLEFDSNQAVILSTVKIVDIHFYIFDEETNALGERLVNICTRMWDDVAWDSVVRLCVKCLTSHSYLTGKKAFDEASKSERKLKNKVTVLVLTLFVQSINSGKTFKRRSLVQSVTNSTFVAASPLLKALSLLVEKTQPKDGAIDHFMKNFASIVENKVLHETIFSLLDTMMPLKEDPYFNRMLVFTCAVAIRITSLDVLSTTSNSMSLVDHLIQVTESSIFLMNHHRSEGEVEVVESSIPLLIFRVFCSDGDHQQLSDFLLLHIWLGVVPRLANFPNISDHILRQNRESIAAKSPFTTLKTVFKLFLDLTLAVLSWRKNLSDMIDLLLANFMDKPFDTPADILLFLSDVWLDYLCFEWQELKTPSKHSLHALKMGIALVTSLKTKASKVSTKLTELLSTSSFIIPSALLACTSANAEMRSAATRLLAVFSDVPNCPVASMIKYLSCHFEEIVLDEFHCAQALGQYFNVEDGTKVPAKLKKQRNTLLKEYVANHVASLTVSNQSYLRVKFYEECLGQVNNPTEHQVLFPCINKLLDESGVFVSDDRSLLISIFLGKVAQNISNVEESEKLYLKALHSDPNHFNSIDDKRLVPQLVALELLRAKFFASLSDVTKGEIVRSLIEIKASTTMSNISTAAAKAFKSLTMHSRHITSLLKEWFAPPQQGSVPSKRTKVDDVTALANKEKESKSWKEFIVSLELLHHKKRIQKPQDLIGPFFDILMRVIDEKIVTDNPDYVTLLLLGCLLNMFERSDRLSKDIIKDIQSNMKVELLVKCIQSTENTQTHHHALMLLAKSTYYCPEKVLHSVMSIFTFMGNTLLRRDDSYSFQVITKTIQTVIPPLLRLEKQGTGKKGRNSVLDVLQVFVDALPHIPTHRRLIVFEELLTTLGAADYLWQAVVMLLDQHVCQLSKVSMEDNEKPLQYRGESSLSRNLESSLLLWTSICQLFDSNTQIEAVLSMLAYLQNHVDMSEKSSKSESTFLLDTSKRSTNQMRRFRIVMLTLSSQIIKQIKPASDDDDKSAATAHVQRLFKQGLFYLELVTNAPPDEDAVNDVALRYQQALVRRVNDLLEKVNSLLPLRDFLSMLDTLLTDNAATQSFVVKQKAIQLFHIRISNKMFTYNDDEEKLLLDLSQRFVQMLIQGCKCASKNETLLHTAALGLTQIVRTSCQKKPSTFVPIQPIICGIVNDQQLSDNVLSSLLICLGEVTVNLKAHSIVNLAKISPCLIELLSSKQALKSDVVLTSLLTTVSKLFSCLGHFLSPFVADFLAKLSMHSYMKRTSKKAAQPKASLDAKRPKKDSNPASSTSQLLSNVLSMMANNISSRVLIPSFRKSYDKVLEELPLAASCLLPVMRQHVGKLNKAELTQEATNLMTFLLHCMDFRLVNSKMSSSDITIVEKEALEGVILLLIKLPESVFRPLYIKLHDWGCSESPPPERVTTFYKCTALMAAKLKGLFEIFASDLLNNIIQELKAQVPDDSERHQANHVLKLSHVMDTLRLMLTHSSATFITQERFEELIHPLVNQLEISISDQRMVDDYIKHHVIDCVGQLAASARDNVTWQPLNYHILMKTRHSSPQVRCHALNCLTAAVDKLGDDYLLLLPETIPFLAELLEDESDVVEECCQRAIKEMEEKLGEPLQKYF